MPSPYLKAVKCLHEMYSKSQYNPQTVHVGPLPPWTASAGVSTSFMALQTVWLTGFGLYVTPTLRAFALP